jgi:crotonobetainyl-CoA:carnitine CoA-transferase CaiB-like acyl-CoA transferase
MHPPDANNRNLPVSPAIQSALDSLRVVELTEALSGPWCAMLLGDLGADVIKVERPLIGDQARRWGPPYCGSESAYFLAANRNKRSIALDYDHPVGREALERLLARADVFLVNQPNLESLRRRSLDPDALLARFPRLIVCSITGYGLSGPNSGQAGYDIIAQAEAGIMSFTGNEQDPPIRYPVALADLICGVYSTTGILAALLARHRTGRGQFLDMALVDSQLTLLANIGSNYLNAGLLPEKWGNAHPSIVPYQVFQGRDGRYFVLGVATDTLWRRFASLPGVEDGLGADQRFATNPLRIHNREALVPLLQTVLSRRDAGDWVATLKTAAIPAALIHRVDETLSSEQVIARGLIVELEHPLLDQVRSIANPMRLSATPPTYRLPPPLLGEHTDAILLELGLSPGDHFGTENPPPKPSLDPALATTSNKSPAGAKAVLDDTVT